MATAFEEAIDRLRQMPPDRQEAFARLLLREILADEQWMRSAAQNAEWQQLQKLRLSGNGASTSNSPQQAAIQR